jgi:hypothetical protein
VAEIQSIIEAEHKVLEDRFEAEWVRHEAALARHDAECERHEAALARREAEWAKDKAEWESRFSQFASMMTPSTSAPVDSQYTLVLVTGDAPRQLVRSSVSIYIYIYIYDVCLHSTRCSMKYFLT